jgi:DNA gyrase subunit A
MGRGARGVRGISLRDEDEVVSLCVAGDQSGEVLSVTALGYGKRTPLAEYRRQGRAGLGLINIKTGTRNGPVVGVCRVRKPEDLILITEKGKIIRLSTDDVRLTASRNTQGVKLIDLEEDDRVADISLAAARSDDDVNTGG